MLITGGMVQNAYIVKNNVCPTNSELINGNNYFEN